MCALKIALDGIILQKHVAGSHRYFQELVTGLGEFGEGNDYVIFANQHTLRAETWSPRNHFYFHNANSVSWIPNALQQQFFTAWNEYGETDVLHSTAFVPPLFYPHPTVATIFDLTFERFPQTMTRLGRWWWKIFGQHGINRATRIIAISHSTKRDLIERLNVPADKISVVYPATRSIFTAARVANTLARDQLPEHYILFVGTLERRKNIATLIRAFAQARRIAEFDHKLVLVGQRGWLYQDIFRAIENLGLQQDVIILDHVPDEDLAELYARADLFVYLSLYEGFGLPVLEAMACGAPVLVSNSSALPEVVGDAGVLVSPNDVNAVAHEIARLIADPVECEFMRERGLVRAQFFSPQNFIQSTLEVYRDAFQRAT